MSKYTPMIEQYLAVKAQVPDAFLFFRLGDFYEMFFEDAIAASRELEITLTGREGGAEERIPMCGVPYHSADAYITRLIEKGHKVAICEQVENPAEAKGVVRREIVRIVTPGTLMDGKLLQERANNYIACVADQNGRIGFAVCDLSTGELYATSMPDEDEPLLDELAVYAPAELIGATSVVERVREGLPGGAKPPLCTEWDKPADDLLVTQFSRETAASLDEAERCAVSLLLGYLNETQKRSLGHIVEIRRYEPNQYMMIDPFTRRNLELTETVRERSKKGSLLWLLDESVTSMGSRLLRRWIEKPLMQRAKIEERLEAVGWLYNQFIVREEVRTHLRDVYDLERLVARVSYGSANGRDLNALKVSLAQMPGLVERCLASGSSTLRTLAEQADCCEDVRSWIEAAVVEDAPASVRDGGLIREGYHGYLDQLHEADRSGKQWIAELERTERERTGIKSLKIGYNKVFGYFLEVTRSHLSALPEGRYERKQTLANAERFVTPELKEKEALILEAQDKMVGLEYELFAEVRERIATQIERLQRLALAVAAIDAYQAMATVSAAHRFKRPELTDGYDMVIREGRHPVVEAVLTGGSFIANGTELQQADGRILLITGPNMAGKSTYMRQVAIICILAQIGCFVPAESAQIPIVDRIFTRIGAADDLIGGQSTFMVEMMDIQVMTEKATARSLVIIDELGRGTSTGEGMAIAQSVIEYMHDAVGCKTLVSTHFHELALLEETLPHLRNYCMAVKESGQQVTFLRKLIRGAASTSYGIYCARIAGLPASIIDRAYNLLGLFEEREAALSSAAGAVAGNPNRVAADEAPAYAGLTIQSSGAAQPDDLVMAAPRPVQLSLFADDRAGRDARKADARAEQVAQSLRQADLINMTPLAAINLLYELKQKLQDK